MDTAEWEAAGLYRPDDEGADERRALLDYLSARGATVAQMAEAHRTGGLPGVAGELVVGQGRATLSLEEMAGRAGVRVERVRRVLLAAGLPVTAEAELPGDLVEVMTAFEQAASLMGDDAILAFTRVLGAASTNLAEAAVAVFYAESCWPSSTGPCVAPSWPGDGRPRPRGRTLPRRTRAKGSSWASWTWSNRPRGRKG